MYLREWDGIEFASLPASQSTDDKPMSAEFYAQLYAALNARGGTNPSWQRSKTQLGEQLHREVFMPWQARAGRPPIILAVGAGQSFAERVWIEAGLGVTLHDGHEANFAELRTRYPQASFLVGDLRDVEPAQSFDIITLLAVDYILPRADFASLLRRLAGWLRKGGIIVIYTPSMLTVRRLAVECLRRATGAYSRNGYVFWGWWRTPGEFATVATLAGMRLREVWKFGGSVLATPGLVWRTLPLRDMNGLFIYEALP